jgi:hypothetical protein
MVFGCVFSEIYSALNFPLNSEIIWKLFFVSHQHYHGEIYLHFHLIIVLIETVTTQCPRNMYTRFGCS